MSKYRMDDGSVIDTDKATAHWNEATEFDGCSRRCPPFSAPSGSGPF